MAGQAQAAAHWDAAYTQGDDTRSWYEKHPHMSLRMLGAARLSAADAVIDVGRWRIPSRQGAAGSRLRLPCLTSPRPGCSTRGLALVRGLTWFTG